MIAYSLAFLLGIVAVQQLSALPATWELLLLAMGAVLLLYKRHYVMLFLILGLLWACLIGIWRLAEPLPVAYQNVDVNIQGFISSLPQHQQGRSSFDFTVTYPAKDFPKKIHLNWYTPKQILRAGENWKFTVKLQPPYGRLNPGSFDFESWMFANQIGATGYVRNKPMPQQLDDTLGVFEYFSRWRQSIAIRLDEALPEGMQLSVIKALTIGTQDTISKNQWNVFRETGTTHLIVISGSHISLIAGLVYVWVKRGWAWLGILSISPQRVAAFFAWLAALFYSGLAGYSIPTLRAIIMLSVALAAIAWQRNTSALQILCLALIAVLLFDPLAVLSVGFWLSFVAVALLIYVSVGRLGRGSFWRESISAQLATFIGLSPLLIVFFQQVSLIAPIANWVAVPVIGVLVTPLALLSVGLLFVAQPLASGLLKLTDYILQGLWWVLVKLSVLPLASIYCLPPPWYALLFAGIAVLLLLTPQGFPMRYLSTFLFLPLFFVDTVKPVLGNVRVTLLDVGQGLSVVVQTAEHALVFDTGAKFSEERDMGDAVLVPFLHRQGLTHVDTLIVSHADNDHSGGVASLQAEMSVDSMMSSAATWAEGVGKQYCRAGQNWQWDQVEFTILSPPESAFASENDNSCVLKVQAGKQSYLLTGDIEEPAEDWLVQHYAKQLQSTVLIAPHHGSKTSSSYYFLQQVNPQLVLISVGYLNRFHFPHKPVLARYQQLNLPWLTTAEQGAISIYGDKEMLVETERDKQRRYWMTTSASND
ncbi:DNA internalization-related competence protein ComEC/Rec2 [Methylomonas sp. AM2-LC]|uniref:DNA internalization-related competence protein ComEC/Rec2 n=1 Tax=Methylomonas sp. AM2-LC TaxID=3153301 RepID=UPI003264F1B1